MCMALCCLCGAFFDRLLNRGPRVLSYIALCVWIAGFVGLRLSRNRQVCWHTAKTIVSCEPWLGNEWTSTRQAIERQKMCMYIKLSNMWRKHNHVYVERLSATNTYKSKYFRNARRRLRNDSYIERRSAINALIRVKIFKLSAIWDRITCD